ncbi:carboxypeptidase-like regulatory domain-containing protein [Flagellimonas amoyensis]|uniref:carboxypeptidase-like regulatory domain-containing protein n=1 Tax=Flagellimonas amoyensis TaxID=2169401 RepID=UPI000D38D1A1|nr:carboxypeptidase-like regulatory domain-containing protein [Allomuricauda amoyensis]
MRGLIIFLILLPSLSGLYSQQFVTGRLLDSISNNPVVFASIIIKGSTQGVISNEDGSFRIPIALKNQYDELVISSIGYESIAISLDTLFEDRINYIYVMPKTIQLEGATVISYTDNTLAKRIVKKAIRGIPENFPTEPFSVVGYYRDYQQDSLKYVNLNESIVEIQDKGFNKKDQKTTDFKIYYLVKNQDFPRDSISSMSYDYEHQNKIVKSGYLPSYNGNELIILRVHDAIRNYNYDSYSFIYKMKRDFVRNHQFSMGKDAYLDGEWLYRINFETIEDKTKVQGQIVISKHDFAIYGLDYIAYQMPDLKTEAGNFDLNESDMIFQIHSEYRPYKSKMYLNYLSFGNGFTVRLPPVFMLDNIRIDPNNKVAWLEFNNTLDMASAKDSNHYKLFFRERDIPFKVLTGHGEANKVLLRPLFESERDEQLFYGAAQDAIQKSDLKEVVFKIKGLKDVHGNILGYSDKKEYEQFREFFTQKIILGSNNDSVGFYMDQNKPLFQSSTPIEIKDSIQGYWMNTPLKEVRWSY